MAFFSKFGNILRQTANMRINSGLSASNPSMFQALRFMSSSKLFIGGLSYNTDDSSLRESFCKYGEVIEARVIVDRETGRSRGFGFVTFTATDEASSAIQALDGQELHGRRVRVNYATDRARSGGFGGGGGSYGGGGFGGGGGGYGGGGGGYGGGESGGYGGGDTYNSGGGNYFSAGGNSNVAGGGGGSDNYFGGGGTGGSGGFAAGGGSSGFAAEPADGFGGGGGDGFNRGDGAGEFSPDVVNDRDRDDEAGDDYANRRA